MKKDIKTAIIKQIKSLIGPCIILLIIMVGVFAITFYKGEEEVSEVIKLNSFDGSESSVTLENDSILFSMDLATTQFTVTNKADGAVWYSNPQGIEDDELALKLEKEKLQSTLLLTYSTQSGVDTLFNNYAYSMASGIYDIEQGDDYVKVCYSIANAEKEFIIPTVMGKERFEAYLANMSKESAARVTEYYKKYDINKLGKKDNKEELLANYPILENEVAYILRSTTKDNIKTKLEEYFAEAGYTYEDYENDKENGAEGEGDEKPAFNVNVIYRIEGNDLIVEIPFDEIEFKEKYPIYYLSVLPYFGAGNTEDEGYLLVPEGGGALINFNNGKIAQNSYFANMYGWDNAQDREAIVHETETYFNAFGVARNGSSFLCVLEDGAPYAGVAADISGKSNSYNYAYAQYTLMHRDSYEMGDRASGAIYVYQQELPAGEVIRQRYCFVDSGDYSDLAVAYRGYLQNHFGEYFAQQKEEETPVAIEIVGAVDKIKQVCGVPVSRPLELTTYEEAQSMLETLQAEGVANMSVKLTGWMNGGVQQKILKKAKPISTLGGKKDLKELTAYAKQNGIDFYLDGITNYAYESDIFDGFFVFTDAARFVNREKAAIHPYSTVTYAKRDRQEPHYLLKGTLIPEMIDNLANTCEEYDAYLSFRDVGRELNSDYYRKNLISRQSVMESQSNQLKGIRDSGQKIMINMGNNYAIGYCDFVTNMDLSGSVYTILDESVPVYQMAVHGYVNYAGESLNLTQNKEQILLESAEYGAGLAFSFMNESAFTLQNTLYTQYFGAEYDAWHDNMMKIYTRYNEELGHTFRQQMVGHDQLTATLSCTSYEDGTKVYVNYGYDTVDTPDGKSVPARDYLVVK